MNLALAIIFLWVGCALLYVAFHPMESAQGKPSDVLHSLQSVITDRQSAYG